MSNRLSYVIKDQMVQLAGACFWYWNSFYDFLESSGVPRSLHQRFPRESYNKYDVMRNVLTELEESGQSHVLKGLISNFFSLKGPSDPDKLDSDRAKKLLDGFRESVGNDPIEYEIRRRESEKKREDYQQEVESKKSFQQRMESLNMQFQSLCAGEQLTPQQRGFALERLFFDLLCLEEFECTPSYRTDAGEQIDGHFKYEKFDYLVEAKWTSGLTKQKDLAIFDGKIRGKAQSTRGFFLAAEGFDSNAVDKFRGDAPRIVLMTGEDLAFVLNGTLGMHDLMGAKLNAIVLHGIINFPARKVRI